MEFKPGSFRSDEVNRGNVGHVFVRPELELTKPPHDRSDQPSQAQIEAFLAGTPRYDDRMILDEPAPEPLLRDLMQRKCPIDGKTWTGTASEPCPNALYHQGIMELARGLRKD